MIAIAFPMVISQACDTIMIFTDRLFLSKQSIVDMNAVMGGGLTVFMMMCFFIGLSGYSTALIGQYLGANQKKYCSCVTFQTFLISIFAYIPIMLTAPLAYKLFVMMKISPQQLEPQMIYFNILLGAVILNLLRHNLSCFFSGIGKTGVVMIASCVAMLVNVGASYVLIFGKFGFPVLGIRGAAYGTILGTISSLLILIGSYFSKKISSEFFVKESFIFNKGIFFKLWRFGFPSGLEFMLNILAFNITVLLFHAQGLVTATAATIVFNWDLVSFVPLIGIEIAVMSLVGRSMGEKNVALAHRSTMAGLKMGMIYSSFILLAFIFFPHVLVNMFRPQENSHIFNQSLPLAIDMVRLASIYVLIEALFVVFIGALRGAGDTFWAMIISVSLHWMIVIALYVMFYVLKYPPLLGWAVMVGSFFVFSFIVLWRYLSGAWKKINVIHTKESLSALVDGLHEPAIS